MTDHLFTGASLGHKISEAAEAGRVLQIWTVYDHPLDKPDWFVARRFDVGAYPEATDYVMMAKTLDGLREMLPEGLVCIHRHEGDDPCIVETWL